MARTESDTATLQEAAMDVAYCLRGRRLDNSYVAYADGEVQTIATTYFPGLPRLEALSNARDAVHTALAALPY